MRRSSVVVALGFVAGAAHAADCAKLTDGQSPLTGWAKQTITPDEKAATLTLVAERSDHTLLVIQRDGSKDSTRSDYDRQILTASRVADKPGALSFQIEPGDGDPWSLQAGAKATYRQGVSRDGELTGVEIVVQTVGASRKQTISGCEVDVVPIHREIGLLGGSSQRVMDMDYAPAIRMPLRIAISYQSRLGDQSIETTIESLDAL